MGRDPRPVPAVPLKIRALLLDLEGTLYEAGRPVAGVPEALAKLSSLGIPHGFVTNTTSRPRSRIAAELSSMGIRAEPGRIFTAPLAASRSLAARGLTRCHLMVAPAVLEDFAGIEHDSSSPQAVVVGDVGEGFSFAAMNEAFRLLMAGVPLVTLARNRYYLAGGGLVLDQGPFVAALEYAARCEAILVGKPAPEFFAPALEMLGVSPGEVGVVGDDLEVDVGGAQACGMRGILVRTGKYRPGEADRSPIRPDAVLESAADLPALLFRED